MIRIIEKEINPDAFKILVESGLYTKFCNDEQTSIYVTNEQYAIGYCIQEIDKLVHK
jgi:hypothetical protein